MFRTANVLNNCLTLYDVVVVKYGRSTLLWMWICSQEESQPLRLRHEERRSSVGPGCCYFSLSTEFSADDSQPSAEISADNKRETGTAAAT